MGKPSTKGGFAKSVKIYNTVHNAGEQARKTAELMAEASKLEKRGEMLEMLLEELRPKVEVIIKKVFIKFCEGHKLDQSKIDDEWTHFRKILRRFL